MFIRVSKGEQTEQGLMRQLSMLQAKIVVSQLLTAAAVNIIQKQAQHQLTTKSKTPRANHKNQETRNPDFIDG